MAAAENPSAGGEASPDPLLGQVIASRYKVLSFIAQGGMGRIYRAEQMPLGRTVALKVLHATPAANGTIDPGFQRRFLREAATCAKLTHPNTVRVFDYGQLDHDKDACFMAMELLEGRTLSSTIRREGPFVPARAFRIACQIARSLREAHRLGIVHRDLKSPNVMLIAGDEGETVKVLDFGLAKVVHDDEDLTLVGAFIGSPRYMAPEQIRHGTIDHRTDVYSLGVILYEMLAGKAPFDGGQPIHTMMAHLNDPVPPIVERTGVTVRPEFEQIARRCLAKAPEDRYADMDAFFEGVRGVASALGEDSGVRFGSEAWDPSSPGLDGAVPPPAPTQPVPPPARPSSVAEEPTMEAPRELNAKAPSRQRTFVLALVIAAAVGGIGVVWRLSMPPARQTAAHGPAHTTPAPDRGEPGRPTPAVPPEPGPATPPVAAASHGTLIIRSVPDHADVFRGEERLGATPLEVPLEAEPITLSLRAAGFAPETIVQAPAEGEVVTTVQLRRRRGGTSGNAAHTPAQLDIKTAR